MTEQPNTAPLFSAAQRKHLDGDLESAEALYREIIQADPGNAQAMHYLGYLLQQTDRLAEAHEQLAAAIALDDRHSEWHFNLGIVLSKQGQAAAAAEAFSKAVVIDPGKYFYWTNLGAACESNQEWVIAEQCYQAAIDIDPDCPDAFFLMSALCLKLERFQEAQHFNYRGIVVSPAGSKPKVVVGQALYELGRVDDAIALLEDWLVEEPGNPVATHLLAAYRGRQIPAQCSNPYVEQTFDEFANSFENVLGRLKYCGPQLVQDFVAGLDIPAASLSALDLGCGTGLIGEVLKPYARELVGVDLSQAMLDRAAAKRIYRQVHKTDITEFLHAGRERYDLIACMDTFIYLGRLEEVAELLYQNLVPGGLLIFSTEKLSNSSGQDYRLNISGRYSHHQDYLDRILRDAGFAMKQIRDMAIRTESGCPIEGQFVCVSRPAG
ncbi:tetratricopeptide repeat protein [Sideroxydans lithotrophicus]|uniref:Methyltransferase type 12 n=1 Tax=Sideroxydans lithotrophicus (strain ES-1) TaxID=580332 RepID=D5CMY4_SIDLE|nr:tetratricopeptide repeat protein [Sideroxydans lithotrophicus]ADE10820.1 Methyltransferase type 12 [Sideroxydans lithotrophicus ES-1]